MSFESIRLFLPWLVGRPGPPDGENWKKAVAHATDVMDGLLWCAATGVIDSRIRDICLFLLLKAANEVEPGARTKALKYLLDNAPVASRTRVPLPLLRIAAEIEGERRSVIEEKARSWKKDPFDTPRFVSTVLHPTIVSLLVPGKDESSEWTDEVFQAITVSLELFYQSDKPERFIEDVERILVARRTDYQAVKTLSLILRDPRIPPVSLWRDRLRILQSDDPRPDPYGHIHSRVVPLYLHEIVLPLSRRVIALYTGPQMTQRSEFWALAVQIVDMLRDTDSYGDSPGGFATAWREEIAAIRDRLTELPDESFHGDPGNASEVSLRDHLAWAFLNAVSRDFANVSSELERGR